MTQPIFCVHSGCPAHFLLRCIVCRSGTAPPHTLYLRCAKPDGSLRHFSGEKLCLIDRGFAAVLLLRLFYDSIPCGGLYQSVCRSAAYVFHLFPDYNDPGFFFNISHITLHNCLALHLQRVQRDTISIPQALALRPRRGFLSNAF